VYEFTRIPITRLWCRIFLSAHIKYKLRPIIYIYIYKFNKKIYTQRNPSLSFVKWNQFQIVFTLCAQQTEFRLLHQIKREYCNYNPNLVVAINLVKSIVIRFCSSFSDWFSEFRLFPNQSVNGKYDLILIELTRNRSRLLCLYAKRNPPLFISLNKLNSIMVTIFQSITNQQNIRFDSKSICEL